MALFRTLGIVDKNSKKIEIPLIQAAQTRRSDADDSKAIMTLYSNSGFVSIDSNIIINAGRSYNGATISILVGDSTDTCNTVVFQESYTTISVNKPITINLKNKKYVKIMLTYRNQDGDASDAYGAFLQNTTLHKK